MLLNLICDVDDRGGRTRKKEAHVGGNQTDEQIPQSQHFSICGATPKVMLNATRRLQLWLRNLITFHTDFTVHTITCVPVDHDVTLMRIDKVEMQGLHCTDLEDRYSTNFLTTL